MTRNEYYKPELPLPTIPCPEHGPDITTTRTNPGHGHAARRGYDVDEIKRVVSALT